jgi:hypothetical protein
MCEGMRRGERLEDAKDGLQKREGQGSAACQILETFQII